MKRTILAALTAVTLSQPAQANELANALAAIIVGAIAVDAIKDDSGQQQHTTHVGAPRLTDWQSDHNRRYHNSQPRVCYREVIHLRGYTVVRELTCRGRILRETTQYNRY